MSEHLYQIHDIAVQIRTKARPVPGVDWLFQKLDAFAVERLAERGPRIEIEVSPFTIDTRSWFNVDHQFHARPNELYFEGLWNGIRFHSHWHGIDENHTGPIRVKIDIGCKGLMRFPWLYQADWICHMFVLKPLTEMLWARRNRFMLHASAAAADGQAAVFTGYGSSLKTSFTMALIRRGWQFLGDDQVLLTEKGLLPMPVSLRTFDFRVNHLPTEYLTATRLLRLGRHLLKRREPQITVATHATIGSMNVLVRTDRDTAAWRELTSEEAARRIIVNCRAETIQSTRASHAPSRPLLAYQVIFPGFDHDAYWSRFEAMLAQQLEGRPTRWVELTKRWDDRLIDSVALPKPV